MPFSISNWRQRGYLGLESSHASQIMLIGSYQRDPAHNILSWKNIQRWTISTNRTRKIPMVLKHLFQGLVGQQLLPFPSGKVQVLPQATGVRRAAGVCVGRAQDWMEASTAPSLGRSGKIASHCLVRWVIHNLMPKLPGKKLNCLYPGPSLEFLIQLHWVRPGHQYFRKLVLCLDSLTRVETTWWA